MNRVLLITNIDGTGAPDQREHLEAFTGAVSALGQVELTYCAVQDLLFVLKDQEVSVILDGGELSQSFDVIHLRNYEKFSDPANALRLYCEHSGLRLINAEDANYPYIGKLSQGFLLALNGIPTPDFVYSPSNTTLQGYIKQALPEYPFVVKYNVASKGLDNYLVGSEAELNKILSSSKQGYLMQPYIRNHGELRILYCGLEEAPLVFKKSALPGAYLNNTSQGATASQLGQAEVDEDILDAARKAARITDREVAGVDVLLADDGRWYVLEVNATPSLATGALSERKQELYSRFVSSAAKAGA